MNNYNYIDLFAGIGGFALGAHMAGMKFKEHFASEIDPFCVELYQKRFPDSIQLGDIKQIDCEKLKNKYGNKWIMTGGFPCQDISCAGKREGIHGERSSLWFEYWRLIRDLRPRFAIVENVGMLIRRGLRELLASLAEIGYNAEWQDIRAEDVGAPHRRERIWIVAYPSSYRWEWKRERREIKEGLQQKSRDARLMENGPERCSKKIPNANKQHDDNTGHGASKIFRERSEKIEISECLANPNGNRFKTGRPIKSSHKKKISMPRDNCEYKRKHNEWAVEPDVGRLVNGVSNRVDRLKGLGNSIVPQIAAIIWQVLKNIMQDNDGGDWLLWPNCPIELKGKTIAIPDDWRPK